MAKSHVSLSVLAALSVLSLLPGELCQAAITTTGDVAPDPNTTTSSSTLYVGNTSNGTLLVNGGSDVNTGYAYMGYNPGVSGSATVDGIGSTWTNPFDLYVGDLGD